MNSKIAKFSVCVLSLSLMGCGQNNNTINYVLNNGDMTAMVVSSGYNYPVLNIPETITVDNNVYTVVSIQENAFKGNNYLKEVTIPDTVTIIGYDAFRDCKKLESVIMSDSIEVLPDHCFSNCQNLVLYTGGEEVKTLLTGVFEGTAIKSFNFTNLQSMGIDCFWNNQHLEEVNISGSITNISGSAFEKCTSLKKVTLGSSVTAIDSYVFKNCENLSELNFDYITNIASYAFENCGFTSLSLSGKEISSHAFNNNKKLETLSLSNISEIGLGAFKDCDNLSSLSVSNVKIIGSQAFMNDKISSLSFDSSLEEIRSSAFENNQVSAISFTDESSLRLISRKAFYNNEISGNLILPDSLEYIYAYAFQNNNLQEVSLSEKCSFESNSFDKGINVVVRNENNQ